MNKDARQYLKAILNLIFALIVILLLIFVVPKVLVFFLPLIIGWIIAAIANPPVKFLEEKLKITRKATSAVVIVFVLAAVVSLVYFVAAALIRQGIGMAESIPEKWAEVEESFNETGGQFDSFYEGLPEGIQNIVDKIGESAGSIVSSVIGKVITPTLTAIGNFAKGIPNLLVCTIMTVLAAYYFVADRKYLTNMFNKYMPARMAGKWSIATSSMKKAVGGYFLAQLKIEAFIYVLLVIGLFIIGVDYVPLVALGIAFLDFLPFLGTGTVMVPWAIIEILSAEYRTAITVLIVWIVTLVIRQLIQPRIMGAEVDIPAIPTIILIFIGYRVAGVLGMIVALPIALIVSNLNENGVFDTPKNSLKLLVKKVNRFRTLSKEDLDFIQEEDATCEQAIETSETAESGVESKSVETATEESQGDDDVV